MDDLAGCNAERDMQAEEIAELREMIEGAPGLMGLDRAAEGGKGPKR